MSSRDLRVTLSGVTLDNPVIPASGTYGFGQEFTPYYDINILGSLSFKGTTAESRFGNPTPRIAECPNGMLNSVGGEQLGRDRYLKYCPHCGKSSISRLSPTSAASRWRNTFTASSC